MARARPKRSLLWFAGLCIAVPARAELPADLVPQIQAEVSELRGLPFERPVPVVWIDDAQAIEHMKQRIREFQSESELQRVQRAYELLGLVPPGLDLLEVFLAVMREQAGGFYDPSRRSFYLLEDLPPGAAPLVVAHELTHALEDQHYDLDRRLREVKHDDDRLLARSAVHEGSATLLMTVFAARRILTGRLDAAALQELAEFGGAAELERLPPVFLRQLMVPYLLGTTFLARGDLLRVASGNFPAGDVDAAYLDPPQSSEQILHPEKYWVAGARDEPRTVHLGEAGRLLGRRWKRVAQGVLGELSIGVLVGAPSPREVDDFAVPRGESWTNDAAAGWGGDRWELWRQGAREVVLLSTVWDTPEDAAAFASALPRGEHSVWERAGDRVALVAGDGGPHARLVLERMLAAPVPLVERSAESR